MELKSKIEELLVASFQGDQYFLVDLKLLQQRGGYKIVAEIDSDTGITVDECAEVSRYFVNKVEEENLIEEHYVIEVSSPGLDKPFKLIRQYHKNIGRTLKVILKDGVEKNGVLKEVTLTDIVLSVEKKEKGKKAELVDINVPLEEIKKTNIVITF